MFGKKTKKLLERASAEAAEFKRPYPEPKSDLEGLAKREAQPAPAIVESLHDIQTAPRISVGLVCPTCGGSFSLEVCPTDGTQLLFP